MAELIQLHINIEIQKFDLRRSGSCGHLFVVK